ncbi:MAG: tripartite tricarboxylate transporter substrate binding protein [Betaproteobacteria bacterium]|nr:tripartite tricarboxylate transporter substrate binding protein [Betaproteobacteria bacterium]
MRKIALSIAGFTLLALAAPMSYAQSYPSRPIHMVVPFPSGGAANDMRARIIADKLSQSLGKQVIVENRPGADGAIGTEFVAKAAPDGYTLLLTEKGLLIANPVLFKKMRYDPVNDFEHITLLITTTVVLAANPSLPVGSVKELIALAKAKPGQLNYGTGISSHYLIMEMFKLRTGVNMLYVPYKGSPPAVMALMSGETQVMFGTLQSMLSQIKGNKVKALAMASSVRSPALPEVPTISEAGLPGFEASTFTGFAAPAGTPKEIVRKLYGEISRIARMPDVRDRLEAGGDVVVASTPEEFTDFIKSEIVRYRTVVKDAGIRLFE